MPQPKHETRLGGARFNRLYAELVARGREMMALGLKESMTDGYPPLHQPLSPRQQYLLLLDMRNAGDPRFWNNPAAQKALNDLSPRFYGKFPPPLPLPEAPSAVVPGPSGVFGG